MKKVVVIGGGFAGSLVAKKLERDLDVTLIDTKNYFEFTPGVLRTIINPGHVKRIQVLHTHYLRKAKVVVGRVKEVRDNCVLVNGKKIKFDYLVICSGSRYESPIKSYNLISATRASQLRDSHYCLEKAKKIVIVGGGLVGVELAGEISTFYKDKEVTIVHSKSKLISRNSSAASRYAEKFLKKRRVKILFNRRGKKFDESHILTDKGDRINADLFFLCTGIKPNSTLIRDNFPNCVDSKGYVRVNKYLQLNDKKNVFVAGDVNYLSEEKTAQNAERQARVICKNLMSVIFGGEMVEYTPKKTPIVISLGKFGGIFDHGKFVITGWIPAFLKWAIEKREMLKKKHF